MKKLLSLAVVSVVAVSCLAGSASARGMGGGFPHHAHGPAMHRQMPAPKFGHGHGFGFRNHDAGRWGYGRFMPGRIGALPHPVGGHIPSGPQFHRPGVRPVFGPARIALPRIHGPMVGGHGFRPVLKGLPF